ncbi:MAG: class II aldolase/adducin family protein [Clostridiales bacterium]|nr:class II aldolase/adducin family protein [Clostridiales bacterium]
MTGEDRKDSDTRGAYSIEKTDRLYPDYLPEQEARLGILHAGKRLYDRGYVVANDGNISCLTAPGQIWATPTGVSKGFMTEEMLIKSDLEGHILEGTWAPSTELMMHMRVYKENPGARAAIHAHSPVATAFACAGIPLDLPILAEAVAMQGHVPLAPFALPGTPAVAESIAPFCLAYTGVLLANHGVLTWGASLSEALYRMERVEYYAHLLMLTGVLPQPAKLISPENIAKLRG